MLNSIEEAEAAADLFEQLDQVATVFAGNVNTGRYNVVLKERLACRLVPISRMSPQDVGARSELMAARDFFWDPLYFMPEQCQVEVSGIRWQPQAGTFQALRAGDSAVLIRRCSVLRVQVGAF